MALDQSALMELLGVMRSADAGDLMRRLLTTILQELVDAEATAFIGAEPHARSDARVTQRNGTRDKTVTTASGDLTIKIGEGPDRLVLSCAPRAPPPDRRRVGVCNRNGVSGGLHQ